MCGYPAREQFQYIQPKSSDLFCLPVVKTEAGGLSVTAEVMAGIWEQICREGKRDQLFYDGGVNDLHEWISFIYNPANHVVLVVDDTGHVYHVAWINGFYQGHGFLHHCGLGKYNRRSWPVLKKYWQDMKDDQGNPLVKVLIGITPITNKLAIKLLKIIKWTPIGCIPKICYMAQEDKYVAGMVSYCLLDESHGDEV